MKALWVVASLGLGLNAHAEICKTKVSPMFDQWDGRTIDAVIKGIDQVKADYTDIGMSFLRSDSIGIRYEVKIHEENYTWTSNVGHIVEAKMSVYNRGQYDQRVESMMSAQSFQSREAAITEVVQKLINSANLDQRAMADGCPRI